MNPALLVSLIMRLPDTSMLAACAHDGDNWRDWLGWGEDRQLAAHLYDMTTVVARAAGQWQKDPKFSTWERPDERRKRIEKESKPATIFEVMASSGIPFI